MAAACKFVKSKKKRSKKFKYMKMPNGTLLRCPKGKKRRGRK